MFFLFELVAIDFHNLVFWRALVRFSFRCDFVSGLWHVVGLVSWGIGCAQPDVPGVYVNVFNYLDFITEQSTKEGY